MCADCGEEKASIFVRRSVSGDVALCEGCARSRGVVAGSGGLELRIDGFIESFFGDDANSVPERRAACPLCGTDSATILREGRLGCSACVGAFRPEIRKRISSRTAPRPSRGAEVDARARSAAAAAAEPRFSSLPYPLSLPAFRGPGADAPEGDAILFSHVRLSRNLVSLPFPGGSSLVASAAHPAADSAAAGRLSAVIEALPGWESRPFAAMPASARLALAELAGLPRHYVNAAGTAFAASGVMPLYALENETDHLRIVARLPGLDPISAAALAGSCAEAVERECADRLGLDFAWDDEFGFIASRLEDCGAAAMVSVTAHLPALAAAGLLNSLFKALMARGMQVRGAYAEGSESMGSLFEISACGGATLDDLASSVESAGQAAAAAERRARSAIAKRDPVALIDAAGRAVGIAANARRIGREEAASLLSSLRLAALAGMLRGADPSRLGGLLAELGPGALAAAAGTRPAADATEIDALRAIMLRDELARIETADEEGGCSRD